MTAPDLYDIDPDVVAGLVISCPAVAGMSGGPLGAAATYLPGRRVAGVQVSPSRVEVHVVARYGTTVAELAAQVRRVLAGQVRGRTVDIVVEDVEDRPASALGARSPARPSAAAVPAGTDVGWPPAAGPR